MSLIEHLDEQAVRLAIVESRELGRETFREKYGFPQSRSFELIDDEEVFDIKAIVAAAHLNATGTQIKATEFSDGERVLQAGLRKLGFKVRRCAIDLNGLTADLIDQALDRFDSIGREEFLKEYGAGESVKYFIKRNSTLYDAKPILVTAMRLLPGWSTLHHGDLPGDRRTVAETLRGLGYLVVGGEGEVTGLAEAFERILELQPEWKANKSPAMQERGALLKAPVRPILEKFLLGLQREVNYSVEYGSGVGNYARVPWCRVYNPAHSPRTTMGWYIVFLPSFDGDSMVVSLNQASSRPEGGQFPPMSAAELFARADNGRKILGTLPGFDELLASGRTVFDITLDKEGLGLAYSRSHVIGYEYSAGEVPDDEQILDDLLSLIPLLEKLMTDSPNPGGAQIAETKSTSTSEAFAWIRQAIHWEDKQIAELVDALEGDRPQLILSGPPGTGKTFVAQHIAAHLIGEKSLSQDSDRIEIVQFHPSYGYEEFVEGLQPMPTVGGGFEFVNVPGKILQIARRILEDHLPRVLIVDEINRANIQRVFGELLFLLEYRDTSINLKTSPHFSLPSNLFIIGTMNTTDRGIRSFDVALRRRFNFFELPPDPQVLRRFYEAGNVNELGEQLFSGFALLNAALRESLDRHHEVGHSFLMRKHFDALRLRFVWRQQIFPLIEEFFFDRPDKAEEFTIERFWPDA